MVIFHSYVKLPEGKLPSSVQFDPNAWKCLFLSCVFHSFKLQTSQIEIPHKQENREINGNQFLKVLGVHKRHRNWNKMMRRTGARPSASCHKLPYGSPCSRRCGRPQTWTSWRQHDHNNPISNTAPTVKQVKKDRLFAANTEQTLRKQCGFSEVSGTVVPIGVAIGVAKAEGLWGAHGLRTGNLCGELIKIIKIIRLPRFPPDFPTWDRMWGCGSCGSLNPLKLHGLSKVHKGSQRFTGFTTCTSIVEPCTMCRTSFLRPVNKALSFLPSLPNARPDF